MPTITGTEGSDTLESPGTGYTILAQGGDDQITVGSGANTVDGGSGHDLLIVRHLNFFSTSTNLQGTGSYSGTISDNSGDNVSFTSIERFDITTGSAADFITTGDGNDIIHSGDGNDFVVIGAGFDTADGGHGVNDYLAASLASQAAAVNLVS
jgi:Ca2+-binding RTX toxin-like protein